MIRIKYAIDNVIHIDYSTAKERNPYRIAYAFSKFMDNIPYKLISIKIICFRKVKGRGKMISLPDL